MPQVAMPVNLVGVISTSGKSAVIKLGIDSLGRCSISEVLVGRWHAKCVKQKHLALHNRHSGPNAAGQCQQVPATSAWLLLSTMSPQGNPWTCQNCECEQQAAYGDVTV